jgi:uncharacterized membrane protein YcaP (DUF421 family)
MKSDLLLNQERILNGGNLLNQQIGTNSNRTVYYSTQPMTISNSSLAQDGSPEQNIGQSGGGGGGGGGSESQKKSQDPILGALLPDPSSILSVIFRTSIIAILVFVIVKWLGGKGIGQLSPFGLLIVVGLGSAIGDPMIYNEISIPQAMMAVIIAVIFFKIIDYLTLKSKKFREKVEPIPILLVDYGQIRKDGLEKAKMDKEEFEIEMRLSGIENVNEIKFARLEPNGRISFILRDKEKNKNTD